MREFLTRALVCGGSKGIGLAISRRLARSGVEVTLLARTQEDLLKARESLDCPQGQRHDYLAADLGARHNLTQLIGEWVKDHPPYQILVNSNGIVPSTALLESSADELLELLDAFLGANHVLTRALLPGMRTRGSGRIVNILSTSARQAMARAPLSSIVYSSIEAWAKVLSNELAPEGITVNNILPGTTLTPALSHYLKRAGDGRGVAADVVADELSRDIPAGRFAAVEEIAAAACFLASPEASYITGASLLVDGGRTQIL